MTIALRKHEKTRYLIQNGTRLYAYGHVPAQGTSAFYASALPLAFALTLAIAFALALTPALLLLLLLLLLLSRTPDAN